GHVRGVHASSRKNETVPCFDDSCVTALRHNANGLAADRILAITVNDATFCLAHHLAGDDDNIAVDEVWISCGDQFGDVIAFAHFADAVDRPDLQPIRLRHYDTSTASSTAARAISTVASRSVISNGIAFADNPSSVSCSAASLSVSSTSQPSIRPPSSRDP